MVSRFSKGSGSNAGILILVPSPGYDTNETADWGCCDDACACQVVARDDPSRPRRGRKMLVDLTNASDNANNSDDDSTKL